MTHSDDFSKIIRPGAVSTGGGEPKRSVFCKIEFKGGRLSISGVHGPMGNGDAHGSCGQIDMSLRDVPAAEWTLAEGWTAEALARFFSEWRAWHLNDMRAYDSEMAAAGWRERAAVPMLGYSFTLDADTWKRRRTAEGLALDALREGKPFYPVAEQAHAAALPLSVKVWVPEGGAEPPTPEGYQRKRQIAGNAVEYPERKTLGWIYPSEHPDGLLTRRLREDGPGYGSAWFREEVPADVLEFLRALPDADRVPAWV